MGRQRPHRSALATGAASDGADRVSADDGALVAATASVASRSAAGAPRGTSFEVMPLFSVTPLSRPMKTLSALNEAWTMR